MGSGQTPQHLSLDLYLSPSSIEVPHSIILWSQEVLEEQVSSSTSEAPEALSTLKDTQDNNIPKGFGAQKGCLAALLGQGLHRRWDEVTPEDEMRVEEQRYLPAHTQIELGQGKTMVEVQILIPALCPHGLLGEAPLPPKWLSLSLVMVVLPGGDPGLKERGPFMTVTP